MTLPWTVQWYETVRGWRNRKLKPALDFYRSLLRVSYGLAATWADRVYWAVEFDVKPRTVTRWLRVLWEHRLLERENVPYGEQLPNHEVVVHPNGVWVYRPTNPDDAKALLEDLGPRTGRMAPKASKNERDLDKIVQVKKSRVNTERARFAVFRDASENANLDTDVHRREDPLLGPSSSPDPDLSDSAHDAVVDAVFSKPAPKPISKPDLGIQKKSVASCAPSPESQALKDTIDADTAYLRDRADVSLDDKEKIRDAVIFIRAKNNPGLYRSQTEGTAALLNFSKVTDTPHLYAVFKSVLRRDIESNAFRKGHDAEAGALYRDAVPF
jgi:hypothetical protein